MNEGAAAVACPRGDDSIYAFCPICPQSVSLIRDASHQIGDTWILARDEAEAAEIMHVMQHATFTHSKELTLASSQNAVKLLRKMYITGSDVVATSEHQINTNASECASDDAKRLLVGLFGPDASASAFVDMGQQGSVYALSLRACGPLCNEISRTKYLGFFGKDHPLSNMHPAVFVIDGVTYTSVEQWMQAQKAILFGDRQTHKRIMEERDPKEIKKLGRTVIPFDKSEWSTVSRAVVKRGVLSKFASDSRLKDSLMLTKDKVIVECSPRDRLWGGGIGVSTLDEMARKGSVKLTGENMLGQILMEVRNEIANTGGNLEQSIGKKHTMIRCITKISLRIATKHAISHSDIKYQVCSSAKTETLALATMTCFRVHGVCLFSVPCYYACSNIIPQQSWCTANSYALSVQADMAHQGEDRESRPRAKGRRRPQGMAEMYKVIRNLWGEARMHCRDAAQKLLSARHFQDSCPREFSTLRASVAGVNQYLAGEAAASSRINLAHAATVWWALERSVLEAIMACMKIHSCKAIAELVSVKLLNQVETFAARPMHALMTQIVIALGQMQYLCGFVHGDSHSKNWLVVDVNVGDQICEEYALVDHAKEVTYMMPSQYGIARPVDFGYSALWDATTNPPRYISSDMLATIPLRYAHAHELAHAGLASADILRFAIEIHFIMRDMPLFFKWAAAMRTGLVSSRVHMHALASFLSMSTHISTAPTRMPIYDKQGELTRDPALAIKMKSDDQSARSHFFKVHAANIMLKRCYAMYSTPSYWLQDNMFMLPWMRSNTQIDSKSAKSVAYVLYPPIDTLDFTEWTPPSMSVDVDEYPDSTTHPTIVLSRTEPTATVELIQPAEDTPLRETAMSNGVAGVLALGADKITPQVQDVLKATEKRLRCEHQARSPTIVLWSDACVGALSNLAQSYCDVEPSGILTSDTGRSSYTVRDTCLSSLLAAFKAAIVNQVKLQTLDPADLARLMLRILELKYSGIVDLLQYRDSSATAIPQPIFNLQKCAKIDDALRFLTSHPDALQFKRTIVQYRKFGDAFAAFCTPSESSIEEYENNDLLDLPWPWVGTLRPSNLSRTQWYKGFMTDGNNHENCSKWIAWVTTSDHNSMKAWENACSRLPYLILEPPV